MFLYFPPLSLNIRRRCFQRVQLQFRACLCKQGINSKGGGTMRLLCYVSESVMLLLLLLPAFFLMCCHNCSSGKKTHCFLPHRSLHMNWMTKVELPMILHFDCFHLFTLCSRQVQHWHKIYRLGTEGETGQKKSNRITNSYFKNHLDILFKNIMISW